jgi:tRNA pseudouridine38-40 synthase
VKDAASPPHWQHFAVGLEYDGSAFHGWQRQSDATTVQESLESALSRVAAAPVRVVAAGRTDAGVHATQQIVGFATSASRPLQGWLRGVNSLTPDALSMHWIEPVPASFNARYSATARRYLYVLMESKYQPAIARDYVVWARPGLADAAMHAAAQALVGEHDFSSFRAAGCQSRSPMRCIFAIAVRRFDAFVVIDVSANAFLHHMVRNIAAALLQVGRGERAASWVGEALSGHDRSVVGPTAPPQGLYLVDVSYGDRWHFPASRPPAILRALGDVW